MSALASGRPPSGNTGGKGPTFPTSSSLCRFPQPTNQPAASCSKIPGNRIQREDRIEVQERKMMGGRKRRRRRRRRRGRRIHVIFLRAVRRWVLEHFVWNQRPEYRGDAATQPPTAVCKMEAQSWNRHTLHTRFRMLGADLYAQAVRINKTYAWSSVGSLQRARCWLGR